jgi:solute carrier family 6 amino acid transporter-like protein 5/7/9/14
MQVPIDQVVQSGPGLTFITYPEAIVLMPLPQMWAILFFIMMLLLGLGSQFAGIQMIATSIIDHWPHLRNKEWKVTGGVCMACFVAGLPMTCNGGVYLFTLMEWHTASWAILLIGMCEVVIFSWIYGLKRTFDNICEMGMKFAKALKYFWTSVWFIITPIGSVGVFIFILTDLGSTEFRGYVFPFWADLIGWMFGLSTLLPLVIFAIYLLIVTKDRKTLFEPTENWGPQEIDGQRVDRAIMV